MRPRILFSLIFLFPGYLLADPTPFAAMDVFELEYADNPAVSPDGRTIVYVRHSNDVMTDRTRANLWQIDADGSHHRPLYSGLKNYNSPVWSPEGDRLAFTSNEEGSTQIYVRWMDTGQTALVTNIQKSPSSLSWSPDGKWLAFTMEVPAQSKPVAKARPKPKGAKWAEPARVIDTVRYQFDGRGIVEPQYRHVFVVPADGGTPRQLTTGNFNHRGPLSWSPDSSRLLFSANRNANWELETDEEDIFALEIDSATLVQLTRDSGVESEPTWSPDGRLIAFTTVERRPLAYTNRRLAVMQADGSERRILTPDLDTSVSDPVWSDNGKSIYVMFDERAIRKVGLVSLKGKLEQVAAGLGGTTWGRPYVSGTYHAAGGTVAFTSGSAYGPAEIAATRAGKTRTLTSLNADLLGNRQLGQVNEINYRSSFDGQEIQGWYITPPGFDPTAKYPLILEIHGGPHSAYGPYFSAELQLMAAAGYVVFYDNHRGSLSYGEKFALLLQYKYSSPEDFADHDAGVDAMIAKGFIDEKNQFITGGSAGGIATAYAIGLTDRFNAAVAAKPVINWISKTLSADSYVGQIYRQFPGPPWEHLDHYWQRSPLSLVGNVTTPTLLMTGEEDRRTPISETEQFYQALKLRGVDTVMVRLPDSSHGIASRPSRLIAKVDNILAWFERYRVKNVTAQP